MKNRWRFSLGLLTLLAAGNPAARISGMRMGATAAATAVWLVIAMFDTKPARQPIGIRSHHARRAGARSSCTISRSQPVARNTNA